MKLQAILHAVLFAAIASLSAGIFAADAAPADAAPAKKAKPHSHMEEKTGVAAPAADAKPSEAKVDEAKVKAKAKRHLHPRDGK